MLDTTKLDALYRDADAADREIRTEMRNNVLLVVGEHYKPRSRNMVSERKGSSLFDNRLRITKNHIHKLHRRYVNSLLQYAGVPKVAPQNELENQDRKDAELNDAVLSDIKRKLDWDERSLRWASDFFTIGEVGTLVRWNPEAGEIRGYEQKINEFGEPAFTLGQDEMGMPVQEPVPDMDKPVYKGQFEYRDLYGFNIWRDPGAKSMKDSPYIGYEELRDTKALRRQYRDKEDALKAINEAGDAKDYVEFNTLNGSYYRSKGKTLVKEMYIRPGAVVEGERYPHGWYVFFTTAGILEEGELPFGVWPIAHKNFDEFPSSARGRSPIKQARPLQAEVNRASSQLALHQVTIGDDKVLYQTGTKLEPGSFLPGVRGIKFAGAPPTILHGRDGGQYLPYLEKNENDLYQMLDVFDHDMKKTSDGGFDAYSLLFQEAMHKQILSIYTRKFQKFMVEVATITLELAKHYLPDDVLIMAVGRKEVVNIEEFRKTIPLHYQIKVEPQDETIETKFGRQLTMQHVLQYTGQNLTREDIGMLIKNMPFASPQHQFRALTVTEDAIENEILAIERGEEPEVIAEMDHDYAIKRLSMRINEADYRYLPLPVQEMFQLKRREHEFHKQAQIEAEIALKNEFIPADGPMVAADVYVQDPANPEKAPKRARIPQRALEWLIQRLEQQGMTLEKLEEMNGAALRELATTVLGQPGGQPPGQAMPPMPPQQMAAM